MSDTYRVIWYTFYTVVSIFYQQEEQSIILNKSFYTCPHLLESFYREPKHLDFIKIVSCMIFFIHL